MEKTALKPPWKSLRDSHFPHSPGDDGAFHFTKNTSSVESAIYPQISRTKQKIGRLSPPSHSLTARISHGRVVAFSATVQLHFYGKAALRPSGLDL
jgi:hypothetical protein